MSQREGCRGSKSKASEIHFDDCAHQTVSKTWIVERLSTWDLDLAP